jgi:nitrogen fixation NifU-like protein
VGMDIYKSQLLDHYRSPRHCGVLDNPHFISRVCNPSCGDSVVVYGQAESSRVTVLSFQGAGCVISQAAASLLMERATGMKFEDIKAMSAHGVLELIGMELGPTRLKCALLPLDALKQALEQYINTKKDESNVEPCRVDCANTEGGG